MTPAERSAEIARLEQELLDELDAGCGGFAESRLRMRIDQLRRAQALQKQMVGRFTLEASRDAKDELVESALDAAGNLACKDPAFVRTPLYAALLKLHNFDPEQHQKPAEVEWGSTVLTCIGCGLTSKQEPSVNWHLAPNAPVARPRCADCAKKANAP